MNKLPLLVSSLLLAGCGLIHAAETTLPGIVLTHGQLRARFTDNSPRLNSAGDEVLPGYSSVAALIEAGQRRNVFAPAGLNYEMCSTVPRLGKLADKWNAPRVAPLVMTQVDEHTVRYTQDGAETSGLNVELIYRLGPDHIDLTFTTWPIADIESSHTFWASYMLFVQNTSLYLRASLQGDPQTRWWELTSAGHNGEGDGTYFRPVDPAGKRWDEFLVDNPVLRQAVFETPASRAATLAAGFKAGRLVSFDNFYFGFVDDHVFLTIFRKPTDGYFAPRLSASGAQALRRPAWDFAIESGPQRAGERRTFEVRFVYKPYAGLDDLLQEVARFQSGAPSSSGR
ncbi:MAG: hypothetical protein HYV95_05275 [Opitutae bacterium]|nr:hypothetical protein [Opitutae bacterium]